MTTASTTGAQPATHSYTQDAASLAALRRDFTTLRTERKLRHRDAAATLGVSEGEALAAFVGEHVVRLDARFVELYEAIPLLGTVMTLTRNEAAVHEKIGQFEKMSHDGQVGLALGSAIDLRIFYGKWASAFAVREASEQGGERKTQPVGRQVRTALRTTRSAVSGAPASGSSNSDGRPAASRVALMAPPEAARGSGEAASGTARRRWAPRLGTRHGSGTATRLSARRLARR
ncbi:ChuX/HutX family heme-like substrate-binding protein, partial [Burkholderia sp. Ap-962]|uniref:ChuX/HutX family heme-like substrate-binding protein n=1 Tax=Burkholderia sp. Ap-962 TaxID=2608333 RepID=UPI0023DC5FA6